MGWHKITDRKTGEILQMVASLDGIDTDAFAVEPLARAPHAHEVLDGKTGRLRDHRSNQRSLPRTVEELDALIRKIVADELKGK